MRDNYNLPFTHHYSAWLILPLFMGTVFHTGGMLDTACRIFVLIISIVLHELGHGLAAYHYGDMTAYNAGRLTLNPLAHFDPFGLLMIMFAPVGWAKPVPINPANFSPKYNRRGANLVVSLAGIFVNFCLALLAAFGFALVFKHNQIIGNLRFTQTLILLLSYMYRMNLGLLCFNILPFPPLDGYWIWSLFMPPKVQIFLNNNSRNFMMALLVMAILPFNILGRLMDPIVGPVINLINFLVNLVV